MDHLTYARAQMGMSLAFHMIFAALGVALPLMMVLADYRYLRTRDPDYLEFSKRMAKGTAILFAVGAVSGTVLSFELGLLWPTFMGTFGDVVGLPFALEGFAFFTEAIFLGIYLYGRNRIPEKWHFVSGILVALSGVLSAFFVTCVNSIMNDPSGFRMEGGKVVDLDPVAAMFSRPWAHQTLHSILACYQATAFALAAVHAAVLLKHPSSPLFRKALRLTLWVGCITALLQMFAGHFAAQQVAAHQPEKLAAAEALYHTQANAPLLIGGIPDDQTGEVRWGVEIPSGLSVLAFNHPSAVVRGLNEFPPENRPPTLKTHLSFQVMVGTGSAMALLAVVTLFSWWRKWNLFASRKYLWAVVLSGPLGMIALEAGWLVTEFGRQPWVVKGFLRTKDAVTPFPHLAVPFWTFTVVYLLLGIAVVYLLFRQLRHSHVAANDPQTVGPISLQKPDLTTSKSPSADTNPPAVESDANSYGGDDRAH
ncbi:MAG: cytochrome ubiquinol oxidase subunit I [Polyangiaceae bacterium]|nr:cytochrome ubiquinol oxidase subunit I [Polyangiaceae bacterium]